MPQNNNTHFNPDHLTVAPANAPKYANWLRARGGIAVWRSANLSNPGASWCTPATIRKGDCEGQTGDETVPYPRPTWQAASAPERIVTTPAEVDVVTDREVKRFRVAVRRGANGLQLKCTDASSRRIRKAVAAAGVGAHYQFDYDTQEAVILVPAQIVPLTDWLQHNPQP